MCFSIGRIIKPLQTSPLSSPSHRRYYHPDAFTEFHMPPKLYDQREAAAARDKYIKYYKAPPLPCDKLLQWWGARREKYPILLKITLNLSIFLIPAECERVFSSAKTLITNRRNALKENIIKAYPFVRCALHILAPNLNFQPQYPLPSSFQPPRHQI